MSAGLAPGCAPHPDPISAGWDTAAMVTPALQTGQIAEEYHLLAWTIIEDNRPLYVESALVWIRGKRGEEPFWMLAHVYRHPREESHAVGWSLSRVYDAPQIATKTFYYPPTDLEIDAFLKDTGWSFDANSGFRLLDRGLCTQAWKAVTGRPPRAYFGYTEPETP